MKINLDCIRDILLTMESQPYNRPLILNTLITQLPQYSEEDIKYSGLKLYEGGYITGNLRKLLHDDSLAYVDPIIDITFSGHEFLNSIREPSRWEKVKVILRKVGSFSLALAGDVARNTITGEIPNLLLSLR